MTVLIDTYDVPASSIILQLYKTVCYEVLLEEVYSMSYNAPKEGKKYTILKDISAKALLAVRDVENVIYVMHQEMLTEKEYRVIKHYTNELICVEGGTIKVSNKRNKRQELYQIAKTKTSPYQIVHTLTKIPAEDKKSPSRGVGISEAQQKAKSASLPYLQVQRQEDVYFPEENSFSEEEDLESDCS